MTGKPRAWVPEDNENRLAEFRTRAGMTVAAMSERIGSANGTIRAAELCATPPMYIRSGKVRPWVAAACKALGRSLEEVFPHEFCAIRFEAIIEEQYPGIFRRQDDAAIEDIIDARAALRYLERKNVRTAQAVMLMANGLTLGAAADIMGCTKERVRQREAKGLRMIRLWLAGKTIKKSRA